MVMEKDHPSSNTALPQSSSHSRKSIREVIFRPLGLEVKLIFLYRPFVGSCCQKCTPISWENFFHKTYTNLGFHNPVKITEESTRFRGWLVRRLCYIVFMFDQKIKLENTSDVQDKICNSKRVQDVVTQSLSSKPGSTAVFSASHGVSASRWKREVLRIIGQIQSPLSTFLIRLLGWGMLKLLSHGFVNVQLHLGQLERLRNACKKNPQMPVVFLSTRMSQMDGLLLPILLISCGFQMPRVVWGAEVSSPGLRSVLKRFGALFFPFRRECQDNPEFPLLSKAVFASYVEQLLGRGHHLLIFLMKPFTGTWHLSSESRQCLESVLDALQNGAIPDVLIVPVGLSYDSVPDPPCTRFTTSVGTILLTILRMLIWQFGCVRVDFAQPFSLKEYITNDALMNFSTRISLEELLIPAILGKRSHLPEAESDWEPKPEMCEKLQDHEQDVANRLSIHALSGSVSCSAQMTVGIVSALLLHKHREGVFLSQLTKDFSWLCEEIIYRNFDVGFSGRRIDLVRHALQILQCCVKLYRLSFGDIYIILRNEESAVITLSQHSTSLLPVFIREAIGACSVNALLTEKTTFVSPMLSHLDILLEEEYLNQKIHCLFNLLPRDILLLPPCCSSYAFCQDVLDTMIQHGLLIMKEVSSRVPACDAGRRRFSEKLMWKAMDDFDDSDSDYNEDTGKRHFTVGETESCPDFFSFLCHLLRPILKIYARTAAFLNESVSYGTEAEYEEQLKLFLQKMARIDGSYECMNRSLAAVAVRTFKELRVLQESTDDSKVTLHLSETFSSEENLVLLRKFIQQFIYDD
ncbi:glycerol-3-phosphate acyltransferase 2, mitochondrial [Microcaecilia unicolor]|uniref:Glycerol-3-phosphate acyltransferase 2, mitochondrial n=1 Tax=Microcaecilia unicolor TaxID=1415580 RepID=A0A6P7XSF3_9AMPH|nr:glycerol-3-phosphate acyltransferase 2, mitochondrial [Microcaecilia unicolor]